MTGAAHRMVEVYRRELDLYQEVLTLAERERIAIRGGRPLSEIIDSFRRKQALLRAIESIDRSIAVEREWCASPGGDARGNGELAETIRSIRHLIQRILTIEQDNEDTIISIAAVSATTEGNDAAVLQSG